MEGFHTLIVGPKNDSGEMVEAILRDAGSGVLFLDIDDGVDDEIRRSHPDLLVINVGVPPRQGLELCGSIRRCSDRGLQRYLPIMFLQPARNKKARLEALRAGADVVQQNPFHSGELTLRIGYLLELSGRLRSQVEPDPEDTGFLDDQTDFYNRAFLLRRLREEFKRTERFQEPLSCVVTQIDGLDSAQKRYGRFEHRNIITMMARILSETSRGNNILAHLAPGLFCFLLPNTAASGAIAYAERLRETIQARFARMERFDPPITLTLGISSYPHNKVDEPTQLLALAENALSRARKMGRNRYFLCSQKSNLEFISSSFRWQPAKTDGPWAARRDQFEILPQLKEIQMANSVISLLRALELKDASTWRHSWKVALFAIEIGRRILSTPQSIRVLKYAAFLHDVGKIGIPERILSKGSALSTSEMALMKSHPEMGVNIVKPLGLPDEVVQVIFHHHESYDGNGYPYGLRGEEIPLGARILAVADAFEALTTSRSYRHHRSVEEAAREIEEHAGSQFDPRIVTHVVRDLDLIVRQAEEISSAADSGLDEVVLKKVDYPYPKPIAAGKRFLKEQG